MDEGKKGGVGPCRAGAPGGRPSKTLLAVGRNLN